MEINFNEKNDIWDKYVLTSPQRSVFAYSKYIISLGLKYELITCYDEGRIAAGAIILMNKNGKQIQSPYWYTIYQGVLLADNRHLKEHSKINYEFRIVEYLINKLIDYYKTCSFCQSWRFTDMRPFQWHNYHEPEKATFEISLRYTGILDLEKYRGFEDYWQLTRTVRRQEFNKANKSVRIIPIEDENILDGLLDKTFNRQGIERSPEVSLLVKSITRQAISNNYGILKMASLDGQPISAILYIFDDRTVYYLFGANDPDFRKSGAGTLLVAHMIQDAFAGGFKEVDFVGVNSPYRGDYKISFNAEIKPYFVASIG